MNLYFPPYYTRHSHGPEGIKYKHWFFKSGENGFKIEGVNGNFIRLNHITDEAITTIDGSPVTLHFKFGGDQSMILLMKIVDALRRLGVGKIHLKFPYFPDSRQDRVCNEGEAFGCKIYADLINNLNFESVTIFDPHSDVTPALIERVKVVKNHEFVYKAICKIKTENRTDFLTLVSPDAGANKKVHDLGRYLWERRDCWNFSTIRADKLRNMSDGAIIETTVYANDLTGQVCVICDDICSVGGTFKALARKLKEKGAAKVYLVVSHNEGVYNEREMKESGIDGVYTTNSLADVASNEFTKVEEIWTILT
jgi:ribose-phosphate pyrophosphokinase